MLYELTYLEILIRVGLAIICGSVIGYEREAKGHDAGLRTHMLVCVGSAVMAMVQVAASLEVVEMVLEKPDLQGTLSTDFIRLTAQIVSGIGFLGAGTIIVTKRNVSGLTTAASIWTTAGIGIAIGIGYYFLTLVSTIAVLIVLRIIKKLIGTPSLKLINIKFTGFETHKQLNRYFLEKNVKVFSEEFSLDLARGDIPTYSNYYTIGLPDNLTINQLINEIISMENVQHISTRKEK